MRLVMACLVACALESSWTPAPVAQGTDTQPPTVTVQSPAMNATGVSTGINVRVTFSEPIQPATLSMELRNSSNVVQAALLTYDAASATATLNPNSDLAGGQTFTATVSGVRDLAGNIMVPATWSFTTAAAVGFQDQTLPQTGLETPTVLQFASDGRLFVAEKSGRIKVFDSAADTTPTIVVDLRINVHNYWDRGMLGMALHPNFPSVPYIYVLYTFDAVLPGLPAPRWGTATTTVDSCPSPPGATDSGCVVTGRLSRLNITDFSGTPLGTANEQVLVEDWWQQFPSHSIGSLGFGADGALYASGGDGASFNYVDYGPPSSPAANPSSDDPANEGGALRSQDLRTLGDVVSLDGAVIRIDPETGAALPSNPLFADGDAKARRIVAHGLRNPFRFTIRPSTSEVWIGDVGWNNWEEINRIPNPSDQLVENFGWPCYEGNTRQSGYDSANRPICENLYGEPVVQSGLASPYYTYNHSTAVVAGEACPIGSSSISGLAFYPQAGGQYPAAYNGALFFSDYSRDCIWAMRVGGNGLPNPSDIVTIKTNPGSPSEGPVHLVSGPGGDIYYVGLDDQRLHRIRYNSGNQPPTAAIQAVPSSGPSPLTVNFSAAGSNDPEGQSLSYAWDLDGDGAFDDATSVAPQFTYNAATPTSITVRVRVSDGQGLTDVASTVVSVNNTPPTPFITTPGPSFTWKVGDPVTFSGGANDSEQGDLPASALRWSVIMHHCPSNCHEHSITEYVGVASGSFFAPDHEYPSWLELRLTATDATGLQGTASVALNPQTVTLTFQTSPTGLQVGVNATANTAPFTRTVIVGSTNSVGASSPQTSGTFTYQFASWSDSGAATHNLVAPASPTTYTASFSQVIAPSGLVAAYGMNEGTGTTAEDWTANNLDGTISGATWTPQGRFGSALAFNGISNWVTVADSNALDLTTGMTLEVWVYPTVNGAGSWRNVIIKERSSGEVYNLYANTDANVPVAYVIQASQPDNPLDARGTSLLPVNTWSHLATTYDGANLRLYVNGVQVGTRAIAGAMLISTGELRIGGNNVWGEYFQGRLDEIRIYNRALTPAEIQTDMNTPIGTDATPPVRTNGQPSGTLPAGTTQATLSLTTNENATCRYGPTAGVAFASLPTAFTTTGGVSHSATLSGLSNGTSYTRYVRCQDAFTNANLDDFAISFSVALDPPPDTMPPVRTNGQPSGTLPAGTTQVTLSLTTNENATCRYGPTAGVAFASLPTAFTTTGGVSHSATLSGLANGTSYTRYVRCQDTLSNANTDDFAIAFSVATPPAPDAILPVVSMTAPTSGATVFGNVTVSATASDNVGVVGVQFLLNGAALGTEDTTAPYSITWLSTAVANGPYQLSARARDAAGNTATATAVSVTVNNNAGLVAAYNFDEGTGSTLIDRSGQGNTGTISGAAWTTQGRFGSALSFDGLNDWVTVNDAPALDLTTGVTLEAWVYPTANGGGIPRNVLIKERTGGEVYNLYANTETNVPRIYVVRAAQPNKPWDARGTSQLPLNTWTHLAATYDGTTLRIFVNGVQVGTRSVSGALLTSTGALRLGGNSIWGEYFQGRLDDIRIYNRALSAAQIQADMASPVQ